MPIYEYECPQCHKVYEHMHSISTYLCYICDECNISCDKIISMPSKAIINDDMWRGDSSAELRQMKHKDKSKSWGYR